MFFFAGEDVEIVFLQVKRSLDDIFVHHLQAVEATIFCHHDSLRSPQKTLVNGTGICYSFHKVISHKYLQYYETQCPRSADDELPGPQVGCWRLNFCQKKVIQNGNLWPKKMVFSVILVKLARSSFPPEN